jgi:hypothetical protein
VMFGRVKLEAVFSHVTEVKLEWDNCILQESNFGHRDERYMHWPLWFFFNIQERPKGTMRKKY